MGITGVPPKRDEDRIRRNKPIFEEVPLQSDGEVRGPNLPKKLRPCNCRGYQSDPHPAIMKNREGEPCGQFRSVPWHPATVMWYEMWRRTPQSMVFTDTDWEFFAETAVLHERYWSSDAKSSELVALAGELRRREEAYGATFESRRKLRMKIKTPQHEAGEKAQIEADAQEAVDYAEKLAQEAARLQEQ